MKKIFLITLLISGLVNFSQAQFSAGLTFNPYFINNYTIPGLITTEYSTNKYFTGSVFQYQFGENLIIQSGIQYFSFNQIGTDFKYWERNVERGLSIPVEVDIKLLTRGNWRIWAAARILNIIPTVSYRKIFNEDNITTVINSNLLNKHSFSSPEIGLNIEYRKDEFTFFLKPMYIPSSKEFSVSFGILKQFGN